MAIAVLICCLLSGMMSIHAVAPLVPGDGFASGWEQSGDVRIFAGQDLYGHINGGAELFHEFGFDRLLVQRYQSGDEEIALEVYIMTSPESALGIYLAKTGKEKRIPEIGARNSGSASQITVLKGSCFIQVNNLTLNDVNFGAMQQLVNETVGPIDGAEVSLLQLLPDDGLMSGTEKLIRGQYGLQPIYTFGAGDILRLGGEVFGVAGTYVDDDDSVYTRIVVEYPDMVIAELAWNHLRDNLDSYLTVLESYPAMFTFQDYRKKYGMARLDGSGIELIVHLCREPVFRRD
jgi:hypothetical protein